MPMELTTVGVFVPALADRGEPYIMTEVIDALIVYRGNISAAARSLGRSRLSLKKYIDKHPEVYAVLRDLREEILDMAEFNYFEAVSAGNLDASRFVLSTLGKSRGYVARVEQTGADGTELNAPTIKVEFVEPSERTISGDFSEVVDTEPL